MQRLSQLLRDPRAGAQAVARRGRRVATMASATPCLICGSRRTYVQTVERKDKKRTYKIRMCRRCQYVSNSENTVDYTAFESVEKFRLTPRVGTAEHKGREFHMAQMGVEILGRSSLQVMVFGAGRSLDYRHIAQLPEVRSVVMSDVVDLGVDTDFINITKGTSRRFDLIIACEVIEHFPDPVTEFPRLFTLLGKNGLLVCSTNIYDGHNVARQKYLYSRGHVSYYSPQAIGEIARKSGMLYDFRLPVIATTSPGPRKRYVLFTRSARNMQRVAEYFGSHPYAPSEDVGSSD